MATQEPVSSSGTSSTPASSLMVCILEEETHTQSSEHVFQSAQTQGLSGSAQFLIPSVFLLPNFQEAWLQSIKQSPGTVIALLKPRLMRGLNFHSEQSHFREMERDILSTGLSRDAST